MFMGPFDQQIAWSTASMVGSRRFIERVWKFADRTTGDTAVPTIIHRTIKKVTDDIQGLKFNTAISTLMICLNELEKSESVSRTALESYLKLLAPFAPHVAEELWSSMGNKKSIHTSEWPKCDPDMLIESEVKIMLQVNGKVRGSFMAPTGTGKEDLEKMARDLPEAKKWLEAKEIRRTIVVPDKLVNIVAT
ncbi:MAG: class I tRNA ligase family protein [Candidatus Paceibacterota bacterium]